MAIQFASPRSAQGGGEFIRNFKDPETRIRLMEEPSDWVWYLEHWNGEIRRFHPCTKDDTCIGCRSMDERTAKVTRKYAFNAIAADGKVRIFQCGKKLLQKFEHRADKFGALVDRDIIVSRMGKGLETEYDVDVLPVSVVDLTQYQKHNIQEALNDAYNRALAVKAGNAEILPPHTVSATVLEVVRTDATAFDPLAANLTELKAYCDANGIPYKHTASRNTLVAAVQNHLG